MLEKLPIGSTTLNNQRKKNELEEKLLVVERAIEAFSRKIIYVSI